jgi:hypothetical protein
MKLPHREGAYVTLPKLRDYLLSETHLVGMGKAKFFRSLGFGETNTSKLEQGLISIAHSEDVKGVVSSTYGTKYIIDGLLQTPTGESARVRTVWIIDIGQEYPRFVTAYPL